MRNSLSRLRARLLQPVLAEIRRREVSRRTEQATLRVALGTLMAHQIVDSAASCNDAEFSAFSQYGEDGIVEYLIRHCDISPETFVEIGVENYREANTRFLAEHRLWRGLVVDLNPRLVHDLARTRLSWRAQVRAEAAFVTRDNARALVEPFAGEHGLGILSVDVDGVDYWLLEQLVPLEPAMIIAEYNSLFGPTAPVTVPYRDDFDRGDARFHGIYYGAGIAALTHLLSAHGYALVACTTAGNNAFFVRTERLGDVPPRAAAEAYRPRRFAEHKALDGTLTGIVDPRRQLHDVRDLPLVDVTDGRTTTVGDITSA